MRKAAILAVGIALSLALAAPVYAKNQTKTVALPCGKAMQQAEIVIVKQKHGYHQPNKGDRVIKVTSSNVGKTVGAAVVFPVALLWAHPKFGALTFVDSPDGKSCTISATGQPANQALKGWDKALR